MKNKMQKKNKSPTLTIIYGVITKIPPEHDDGNKADAWLEPKDIRWDLMTHQKYLHIPPNTLIHYRFQVFSLGEILILNEYGREIAGHGRKPSKWFVECEEFKNIEDAIKRATEVLIEEDKK